MRDHAPRYDLDDHGRTIKARTRFYIGATETPGSGYSLCTHIAVEVPEGLTREEAVSYVAGKVARELVNYAANECLALGWVDSKTDYSAKIT